MIRSIYIVSGIILMLMFTSCATTQNVAVENRTRVYETSYETTFRTIIQTLSDDGFAINNADSDTGIIDTDYSNVSTMKALLIGDQRTKVNAIVNGDESSTRVRLNVSVQKKSGFSGWQSASMSESKAIEYYEEIFARIESNLNI